MEFKTDYKDEIPLDGKRLYNIIEDKTGGIINKDVRLVRANVNAQDGSKFGAIEVNDIHTVLNGIQDGTTNLLINGDFKVNQEGKTYYSTTSKYSVDGWLIKSGSTTVNVNEDGTLTLNKLGNDMAILNQYVDGIELTHNKYYAISAMVDGAIVGGKVFFTDTKYSSSMLLPGAYDDENVKLVIGYLEDKSEPMVQIQCKKSKSVLKWIKLEYGEIVTPFVPRAYAEELVLCQWYYQVYQNLFIRMYYRSERYHNYELIFRAEMRKLPTVWISADSYIIDTTSSMVYSAPLGDIEFKTNKQRVLISKLSALALDTVLRPGQVVLDARTY